MLIFLVEITSTRMLIEKNLVVTIISLILPIMATHMVIPMVTLINLNKNVSSDIENILKEFIISQKAFNKIVEEKLEKLDRLVSKVEDLAHDVEILKIRTTPLQDKPT